MQSKELLNDANENESKEQAYEFVLINELTKSGGESINKNVPVKILARERKNEYYIHCR